MAITFSQQEHWDLTTATRLQDATSPQNSFEKVFAYPAHLGQGSTRFIQLRKGVGLRISHFQLHTEDLEFVLPERSHPLEYYFCLSGQVYEQEVVAAGQYFFSGSGMAPAEVTGDSADKPILSVNVHIEPSALEAFWGETFDFTSDGLAHLIRPSDRFYHQHFGVTTVAMKAALHQLLHCPFEGVTKKAYLEIKVWELMTLLIDQELQRRDIKCQSNPLKSDDIERIHHAKEILLRQLDNPPSLLDLARQVGLNDCTLKRGFRQVFGETAFGYLHSCRMEKARQLLIRGGINVSEASRQVGFANRSYFAASFRKKYGVSPSEYLRQRKNSG